MRAHNASRAAPVSTYTFHGCVLVPDGARLAIAKENEIWLWQANGGPGRLAVVPGEVSRLEWSPDGRSIAYDMIVPDEAPKLGTAPAKPEGAQWAAPLEIIDKVNYRADGLGYIKPGYSHIFVISSTGGAPRQLTFGAFNHNGPVSFTPDGLRVRSRLLRRLARSEGALRPAT